MVRLDSTQGRVPATVSVSPAGSLVRLSVLARVSADLGQAGRAPLHSRVRRHSRGPGHGRPPSGVSRLADQRVKAKLEVTVTSPTGAQVDAVETFRLKG